MLLERMALPDQTRLIVDLVDATDVSVTELRDTTLGQQSPFAFTLTVPADQALVLRAGVRAPDGRLWLTEPYAIAPGPDDLTLPPLRAIATPAMGFANLLQCGGQYAEIGFLADAVRVRFNEQVLNMVPLPSEQGRYFEQPDNPATSLKVSGDTAILRIDGAELAECALVVPAQDLTQGIWNLTEIDGAAALFPSRTELVFFPDGRMSATAGCNRLIGGFQRHGGILAFGRFATTMIACTEPTMAQETRFVGALQKVDGYRLSSETGRLALLSGGTVVVMARRQ